MNNKLHTSFGIADNVVGFILDIDDGREVANVVLFFQT